MKRATKPFSKDLALRNTKAKRRVTKLTVARRVTRRYRNALKELAK